MIEGHDEKWFIKSTLGLSNHENPSIYSSHSTNLQILNYFGLQHPGHNDTCSAMMTVNVSQIIQRTK